MLFEKLHISIFELIRRFRSVRIQTEGELAIDKKGDFMTRSKTYDLREARNFRTIFDDIAAGTSSSNDRTLNSGGSIRFNYESRTVKFANNLNEEQAYNILTQLTTRKILTDKNFSK